MKNNNMISFDELINECFNQYEVYIPLIQRNYKWNAETAEKLVSDLYASYEKKNPIYTVGMITLYNEDNKRMQLIDGQQRVITLFMLLKILEPDKTDFKFKFERDEGIEREERKRFNFLDHISELCEIKDLYTDLERFKKNYNSMKDVIKAEDRIENYQSFKEYILKSLHFLLHISDVEPFDEFINLNKNKTRFVISDRIKANLIIDSSNKEERLDVLNLFKELSEILYYKSDRIDSVWELIKQGYIEDNTPEDNSKRLKNKLYSDENRLKLLCCERYGTSVYDGFDISGYNKKIEYDTLVQYREMLRTLEQDRQNRNWCLYNGFNITYALLEESFFSILSKYESEDFKYIEEYLRNILSQQYEKNIFYALCFIESQLRNEFIETNVLISENKIVGDEINNILKKDKNLEVLSDRKYNWINCGVSDFKDYLKIYDTYIKNKYCLQEKNHENE